MITTKEIEHLNELLSIIFEEYPELNFVVYPKRNYKKEEEKEA